MQLKHNSSPDKQPCGKASSPTKKPHRNDQIGSHYNTKTTATSSSNDEGKAYLHRDHRTTLSSSNQEPLPPSSAKRYAYHRTSRRSSPNS